VRRVLNLIDVDVIESEKVKECECCGYLLDNVDTESGDMLVCPCCGNTIKMRVRRYKGKA
jgi:predicted RNA-binding Zn-ribbon protein involved in translation (DUF1610 family)